MLRLITSTKLRAFMFDGVHEPFLFRDTDNLGFRPETAGLTCFPT